MQVNVTARRFKAHKSLRDHAAHGVSRLAKFYDGIVRGNVVLSYEKSTNSLKVAEITLHVHGNVLTAREKSEDFIKSIDKAIGKIERQLSKYKTKIRLKNKKALRKVKEDTVSDEDEE